MNIRTTNGVITYAQPFLVLMGALENKKKGGNVRYMSSNMDSSESTES